jgi:hypothetical protein
MATNTIELDIICVAYISNMSKMHLISGETLKTFGQGALGAMTFGAYHQYTTNRIMELNNEKLATQHNYAIDKMEQRMNERDNQHKRELDERDNHQKILNEKIEQLEKVVEKQNSWWW